MTPDNSRATTAALVVLSITAALVIVAQIVFNDPEPAPAPTTTTVTTTVTTPVAPCDGPACPPWPSLDY